MGGGWRSNSGFGGNGPSWGRRNASGNWSLDNLGQDALRLIGNVCFAFFVLAVVVFTLLAATYQPDDPLLRHASSSSSQKISSFLTSTSNATFTTEVSVARTGEDFSANASVVVEAEPFINATDIPQVAEVQIRDSVAGGGTEEGKRELEAGGGGGDAGTRTEDEGKGDNTAAATEEAAASVKCDLEEHPIDCSNPDVSHLMMRTAIERFPDVRFYRFGKAVAGDETATCDIAWRFRPKDAKRSSMYKDYRRFVLNRVPATDGEGNPVCSPMVVSVGDYHSGLNAKKKRKGRGKGHGRRSGDIEDAANAGGEIGFQPTSTGAATTNGGDAAPVAVQIVGETVNDSLPVIESESTFSSGKYLLYAGGGDRCKSMSHFLWSFLCSLGEAQYLNRTLVMDLSICLASMYSSNGQNEDNKDFRFYFDFEHLKRSASVVDQSQFWTDWSQWQKKDGLALQLVDDFRVTPMQLAGVSDALIMRNFGGVEPDNYWYRVCEGETESVIQRPWHLIWKSPRLMEIVSAIAAKMNWDFDSVHVVRGDKARNTELWPNLASDTSPDGLLSTLRDKVEEGRNLYVATNERDPAFFNPLKDKYSVHLLDDYKELWDENSEWYAETKQLNNGNPVEFDGYMRVEVDTEVFLRGKKQLETFNDLTSDCKDGINTCKAVSA